MCSLYVSLEEWEMEALRRLSRHEKRQPSEQAGILLRYALEALGLLDPRDNPHDIPVDPVDSSADRLWMPETILGLQDLVMGLPELPELPELPRFACVLIPVEDEEDDPEMTPS